MRLADGTAVILDARTQLRVEISAAERHARLEQGRARMQIAGGRRRFTLTVGELQVSMDRGTVEASAADRGSITMLNGAALVTKASESGEKEDAVPVVVRQHVTVAEDGAVVLNPAPAPGRWPEGLLEFRSAPLSSVAAKANYDAGAPKIRVAPEVASRTVTGVFRAGDPRGLGQSLAAALQLEALPTPDGGVLLRPIAKKNGG